VIKKLLMITAMGLTFMAATSDIEASPFSIGTCLPTGFFRDNIDMTAKLINPPGTVSGTVDATGCHIGVYYDNLGAVGAVQNAIIFGSSYFGVVVNGDVGVVHVDITTSSVHNIGETPFNGTQHGVAIYYRALGTGSATGIISGNHVYAYQKGGITANGAGVNVTVTDNVVTGLGPIDFIAQNGVQIGFDGNGVVRGNEISGNFYTGTAGVGPNPGGQSPPGWQYVSGGLLLFQPGEVKHSNNKYAGNQHNVLMVP